MNVDPLSFSLFPDWGRARAKVKEHDWARAVFEAVRRDYFAWKGRLEIPGPERPTRRLHGYYCNIDGAKLRFDVGRPHAHACPDCGKIHTGESYDGAWCAQMHSAAASQVERAVVLLHVGEAGDATEARRELLRIFGQYAETYPHYALHGEPLNAQGRVMPHRLNEAVWINSMLRSLRWSGLLVSMPAASIAGIETMARLAVELLKPQVDKIHNHQTWLLAAIAEAAVVLRDEALLAWCRDHEFGMDAQIRDGFLNDGMWYENSVTYQYYTLESVFAYHEAAGDKGFSGTEWRQKLIRAVNNPPLLSYADGRMPAYADGWLQTELGDYAHVAERAWALLGEEVQAALYYLREKGGRVRLLNAGPTPECDDARVAHRASVAALLYGADQLAAAPGETMQSVALLEDSGVAVLRNKTVRLALRFGPDGGWHDHRDKLNIDIGTACGWRSLDLGTSGYGSDFTQWLRSPVAHNLIVLDGERQEAHTGRLLEIGEGRVIAESVYEGVCLRRSIGLSEGGWRDVYSVKLATPRRVDWIFHGDGLFTPEGSGEPATLPQEEGYRWLQNVRQLETTPELRGSWRHDASRVSLSMVVPDGFVIYWAEAPGNADGRPLGVVIVRGYADAATFDARFAVSDN